MDYTQEGRELIRESEAPGRSFKMKPSRPDTREATMFYNVVNLTYQTNQKVTVDKYCNGFTVVNTGAVNVRVNGVPLAPPVAPNLLGESVTFGGNKNEIYYGRIDLDFTGGVGECIISQKVYIDFNRGKPFEL